MSTTNISLDFYNNTIVSINAKQEDANSRSIIATCTEHGKKVMLDSSRMSAFIRIRKSDGTLIYEEASISPEGQVIFTLTGQMLASTGKQVADLMILSTPDITNEELQSLSDTEDLSNASVISVMPFYILVTSSAVDSDSIVSTNEFSALVKQTASLKQLESLVNRNEKTRQDNEQGRIDEEDRREAIFGESTDTAEAGTMYGVMNTTRDLIDKTEELLDETETLLGEKEDTKDQDTLYGLQKALDYEIEESQKATKAANDAVSQFNTLVDTSGIILQEEKGAAFGVATLDENKYVPAEQLVNVHSIIPHIYHDTADPNTLEAFGNDNDIYMMVIDD